jgi:hypothetical protein
MRVYRTARCPQPAGLKTRAVDAGFFSSFETGLIGRAVRLPPQFGQRPRSLFSTHSRQNVHSKVQIIASAASGGRSLLQHSQLGRNSSIKIWPKPGEKQMSRREMESSRSRSRPAGPWLMRR